MQLQYNFKNISHTFHGTWFILLFTAHSQEAMLKKICCFLTLNVHWRLRYISKWIYLILCFMHLQFLFCLCAVAIWFYFCEFVLHTFNFQSTCRNTTVLPKQKKEIPTALNERYISKMRPIGLLIISVKELQLFP